MSRVVRGTDREDIEAPEDEQKTSDAWHPFDATRLSTLMRSSLERLAPRRKGKCRADLKREFPLRDALLHWTK